jgi:hypothetical protein
MRKDRVSAEAAATREVRKPDEQWRRRHRPLGPRELQVPAAASQDPARQAENS